MKIICAYAPQRGKPDAEKERFYEEMALEWSMANANELILGLRDFNLVLGLAPQSGKLDAGKERYEEMACKWNMAMANANELVLGVENFNGHVGKCVKEFEGTGSPPPPPKKKNRTHEILNYSLQTCSKIILILYT